MFNVFKPFRIPSVLLTYYCIFNFWTFIMAFLIAAIYQYNDGMGNKFLINYGYILKINNVKIKLLGFVILLTVFIAICKI